LTPQSPYEAELETSLTATKKLLAERFGPRAAGASYLLETLQGLLQTLSQSKDAAVAHELEKTLDDLEDVVEALGADAWT